MSLTKNEEQKVAKINEELERLLSRALNKIEGKSENDICKFLPGPKGGYMHHFTLQKLKHADPTLLSSLVQQFIIQVEAPIALDPKPRAPRGSRKKRDVISFSRGDIEKVLELARRYGEKELIAKFSPRRSFPALKRELIRSIRNNEIDQNLWNSYVEIANAMQAAHAKGEN